MNDLNSYQIAARETAQYNPERALEYLATGLAAEAGEVCGKIAKTFRGDKPLDNSQVLDELGDVLWFISQLATELDSTLEQVATQNLAKLKDRQQRGVIKGDCDKR